MYVHVVNIFILPFYLCFLCFYIHLHLGHLADAFIQRLTKSTFVEGDSNISLWYPKIRIELFSSIPIYVKNRTIFIIAKLPA